MIGAGRSYSADSTSLETFCASMLTFVVVADVAGQPEHELVEQQDDRVEAEDVPGVLADLRQALVQRDVGFLVGPDRPRVPPERAGQQVADQPAALPTAGGSAEGLVQGRGVPVGLAPLLVGRRELGDERLVAIALPQVAVRPRGARRRGKRRAAACRGAAWRRGRRSRRGSPRPGYWESGQVVRHQQELPVPQPRVVLGDDVGQALLAARVRRRREDRVQHGHEVALAGAERAVQVGGPRGTGLHGGLDQAEGAVEVGGQLRR